MAKTKDLEAGIWLSRRRTGRQPTSSTVSVPVKLTVHVVRKVSAD